MPVDIRNQYKVDIHVTEGSFNKDEIREKIMDDQGFRTTFQRLAGILGYAQGSGAATVREFRNET